MTHLSYYDVKVFDTLYNREVSYRVNGKVEFKDNHIFFSSHGHGCMIPVSNLISIESVDDVDGVYQLSSEWEVK